MNNRHNEFAESLRNIMRDREKEKIEPAKKRGEDHNEDTQNLQRLLEEKYEKLFGPIDSDDD